MIFCSNWREVTFLAVRGTSEMYSAAVRTSPEMLPPSPTASTTSVTSGWRIRMAAACADTAAVSSRRTPGGSSILSVEFVPLGCGTKVVGSMLNAKMDNARSEEHTSELQSHSEL